MVSDHKIISVALKDIFVKPDTVTNNWIVTIEMKYFF